MAQFYGYRGYVGVEGFNQGIDLEEKEGEEIKPEDLSEAVINNPLEGGQLGFVCDISKCHFNAEALKILKEIAPGQDSLGEIDLIKGNEDSPNCIGWLGGPMMVMDNTIDASRDYDVSILEGIEAEELEIPEGLKQYITQLNDDVPDYTGNDA